MSIKAHRSPHRILAASLLAGAVALLSTPLFAGNQKYEPLAASVQASLSRSIADRAVNTRLLETAEARAWIDSMSPHLARRLPDREHRDELLGAIYYESLRAGLEPDLVMGLIEVESAFRKYAVSSAGARGYMQVMPFWVELIGTREHNLFHMRTNLRFGTTILRHYLDIERGDLFRALGRYNGSLGRAEYPNMVLAAWQRWTAHNETSRQQAGREVRPHG